ncbi:MAG: hypothetical protein HY547_03815 [Elusimicrobia bacterium]|nr:hypothetical protein [Elusimicrobiota bacterium]
MPELQNESERVIGSDGVKLTEVWGRLDSLCHKLWEEDRVAAVGLQALIEEFRGEITRAEQMMTSYKKAISEQRQTLEQVLSSRHQQEMSKMQDIINGANKDVAALKETLKFEEAKLRESLKREELKNGELRGVIDTKEKELDHLKDEMLKRETEMDARHASKMRELYDELQKKEATTESFWSKQRQQWDAEHQERLASLEQKEKTLAERSKFLEKDYQSKIGDLQKKYEGLLDNLKVRATNLEHEYNQRETELLAAYNQLKNDLETKESSLLKERDSVAQKDREISDRRHRLEEEYRRKQMELDTLKDTLKSEVNKIVREYRAKQEGHPAS